MNAGAAGLAMLVRDSDVVTVPGLDFSWLDAATSSGAGEGLRAVVGTVLAGALVACGIGLVLAVAGWVAARVSGGALGGKNASFFAGGAGAALLGALALGSLVAATGWGVDTVHQWATTVIPVTFSG